MGTESSPASRSDEAFTAPLCADFALPEADVIFLGGLGLPWEAIQEGSGQWLIIHDFPLPKGYTVQTVSVAIRVTVGYPAAPLDMAYFHPDLARSDQRQIPQTQVRQSLDGKSWQRWSRHRTSDNPWRPGVDSIKTHVALIRAWLEREVKR